MKIYKKKTGFNLGRNQLRPFLNYLRKSEKISLETSKTIRSTLMILNNELIQKKKNDSIARQSGFPSHFEKFFVHPQFVESIYDKNTLLQRLHEQNYFRDGDTIKNLDELRTEYLHFLKKDKIDKKHEQIDSLLQDINKLKVKKTNLKTDRDDFIKKNDDSTAKCDTKIDELTKLLKKKGYTGKL